MKQVVYRSRFSLERPTITALVLSLSVMLITTNAQASLQWVDASNPAQGGGSSKTTPAAASNTGRIAATE